MSDSYALKHSHPNGGERIQEFDSLKEALHFQLHNGGILVRRERLPGQPGLWWIEIVTCEKCRVPIVSGSHICDPFLPTPEWMFDQGPTWRELNDE